MKKQKVQLPPLITHSIQAAILGLAHYNATKVSFMHLVVKQPLNRLLSLIIEYSSRGFFPLYAKGICFPLEEYSIINQHTKW